MRIKAVKLSQFRSVANASMSECGGLNILIGKNNAGKSNLLSAIEVALGHLRTGQDQDLGNPIACKRSSLIATRVSLCR